MSPGATPPSHWRDDKGQLHTVCNGWLTSTVPTRIMVVISVR